MWPAWKRSSKSSLMVANPGTLSVCSRRLESESLPLPISCFRTRCFYKNYAGKCPSSVLVELTGSHGRDFMEDCTQGSSSRSVLRHRPAHHGEGTQSHTFRPSNETHVHPASYTIWIQCCHGDKRISYDALFSVKKYCNKRY